MVTRALIASALVGTGLSGASTASALSPASAPHPVSVLAPASTEALLPTVQGTQSADTTFPAGVYMRAEARPTRVRAGDLVELTVRLRGPASMQVQMEELVHSDQVEVLNFTEQSSVAVGQGGAQDLIREVIWSLRPLTPGVTELGPLRIWVDDVAYDRGAPRIQVAAAPLHWNRSPTRSERTAETPVLPGNRPPPLGGEEASIPGGRPGVGIVATVPGGVRPRVGGGLIGSGNGVPVYPGGYPATGYPGGATGSGYPSTGYPGPIDVTTGSVGVGDGYQAGIPGGWSEFANQDPYWEEMIPRITGWDSEVSDASGWINLSAGVGPRPVYVGQQLTYLATAGFSAEAGYRMRSDPEYLPPAPQGVWRVDVPRTGLGFLGANDGELQDVRPFVQAFFPLRSGSLTIPPSRLLYTLGGGGRLGPLDTLTSAPIQVEVLPVPTQGAPTGWDGAVGRFRVDVSLDRAVLAPGESALLTLTVRGAGNVEGLTSPRPGNLRGAVLRPAGERAVVEVRDGVVGGVKVFQWFVTLADPGRVSLGPFLFSYFDPWLQEFQTAATPEVRLEGIG